MWSAVVIAAGGATRVTMKNSWRRAAGYAGKSRTAHLNWGHRGRCPRRRWDTQPTPPAGRQPTAERRTNKPPLGRKSPLGLRCHLLPLFLLSWLPMLIRHLLCCFLKTACYFQLQTHTQTHRSIQELCFNMNIFRFSLGGRGGL